MKHILDFSSKSPAYEPLSRVYKNSKDVDTVITLPRGYWEYVDFLEARLQMSFRTMVKDCDHNPFEDWSLSELLMYRLWEDECRRFRAGRPTGNPHPPMCYEGWADDYHRNKARKAVLKHKRKQRDYEEPVPISVILGSVKELPVGEKDGRTH
ncbi:MAG: hypothetical protein ABJQ71_18945 [Roseibium sp.]